MVRNLNGAGNGGNRSNGSHRSGRSRGSGRGGNFNHQTYRYQHQNFPKLPDQAGDDVPGEEARERPPTPAETPDAPKDEVRTQSPVPGDSQQSVSLVWNGVPPNFKMDPNQLFVLTGPFDDSGSASYEAHPVPKGATVFATPSISLPRWPAGNDIVINFQGNSPLSNPNAKGFNPNAAPFYPHKKAGGDTDKEDESDEVQDDDGSENSNEEVVTRNPSMTVFNSAFPKGKAFPLRQPHPPVYFQNPNAIYPEMVDSNCNGRSGDQVEMEEENNNNQTSSLDGNEKPTSKMLRVEV